jgi:PAS domain S-box-containing protein
MNRNNSSSFIWRRALRYGLAFVSVAAGFGLRAALTAWIGPGLPTYITFYPAVMVAALLAGFGPGLLATALTGLLVAYWILPPEGFFITSPVDRVGLVLFASMGLFMSAVAEFYRRDRRKAAAYEHERAEMALRENEAHRKAAEAVQAERQRFSDVLDMLPAYVVLLAPDYRVPFANRFFEERFGKSNGKRCYEYLFGRTDPCEICETYTVLKTNKPHHWEWTGPDGRNYDIHDFPFTDTDSSPLIMEMGIDITEQKRAEKAVRQGEERYRSLTEATTQIVWTTAANGEVVNDMPSWRAFTGQSKDEIMGWGWIKSLHPDDREGTAKIWSQSIQNRSLYNTEYRIQRNDGKYRFMSVRGVPVLEPDGSIREWIGTCTDITERKESERRLDFTNSLLALFAQKTSAREYLDSAVEVIRRWSGCQALGIRIVGEHRDIPYEASAGFEPGFLELENRLSLGRDKCCCVRAISAEFEDQDRTLLTPAGSFRCDDASAFVNQLPSEKRARYHGNCAKFGFASVAIIPIRYRDEVIGAIHLADRRPGWFPPAVVEFIESMSPLIGEAVHRFQTEAELAKHRNQLEELVRQRTGELEATNLHLQKEIAQRTDAEAALRRSAQDLERSNRDLEQFAYVASHDLQEPLRAVGGYVKLLHHRFPEKLDAKAREYVTGAADGAERMQRLITDLLAFSRVGIQGGAFAPADLSALLSDALNNLQTSIAESGAKVSSDPLPSLPVDATQIVQLFQNLIGNAIKFRSERVPEIHVGARKEKERWLFWVRDNGIGIEPQYAGRIFQIFQRLHTRKQYPGTGIGLAICKKIVERHGGEIRVESQSGQGSTFYFSIPEISAKMEHIA